MWTCRTFREDAFALKFKRLTLTFPLRFLGGVSF